MKFYSCEIKVSQKQIDQKLCSVLKCTDKSVIRRTYEGMPGLKSCTYRLCSKHADTFPFNQDVLNEIKIEEEIQK